MASNLSGHEDCKIEDVGEFRDVIDASTPMFVKHTEAILDEIDEIVCVSTSLTFFFFLYALEMRNRKNKIK